MKLLIIGPEIRERKLLRNFSGVWAYYLSAAFEARGIELEFDPPQHRHNQLETIAHYQSLRNVQADHVLALGLRYFDKVPKSIPDKLRRRLKSGGLVTQIHDGQRDTPGVDYTFTVKDERAPNNHYIGWAADPSLCYPQHRGAPLILIDHSDYVTGRGDATKQVIKYARRFPGARILYINNGGVGPAPSRSYLRDHMPFETICEIYRQTNYFMVTHPESVGITALETAMCGALPIVPKGFIAKDRLDTIRHVEYDLSESPWRQVRFDPEASRAKALENTWSTVADRILEVLK